MAEAVVRGAVGLDTHPGPRSGPRAAAGATSTRLLELRPSRPLLYVSLAALAAEAAWLGFGVSLAWGPTMPILLSALAAPVAAWLWGRDLRPVSAMVRGYARAPAVVLAALAVVVMVLAVHATGWTVAVELAFASAAEEVVYRVALPVVLVSVARRWLAPQPAVWVAVGSSCVVFSLLPGHLDQLVRAGPVVAVTFVGMAALWGVVLWSTGSLWLVVAVHALVNLTVLPVEAGVLEAGWRAGVTVSILLVLVWTVRCRQQALTGTRTPLATGTRG